VARQFLAFTDAHWGQAHDHLLGQLHTASARTGNAFKDGTVYQPVLPPSLPPDRPGKNIRNRPRTRNDATSSGALECSILILLNQDISTLKPSPKKSALFLTIKVPAFLPSRSTTDRELPSRTSATSVDKSSELCPSDPPSPVVTFTYLHGSEQVSEVRHHLEAYLPLFRSFPRSFSLSGKSRFPTSKRPKSFSILGDIPIGSDVSATVALLPNPQDLTSGDTPLSPRLT